MTVKYYQECVIQYEHLKDKIEDYIEILVSYPDKVVEAIEIAEQEVQNNEYWTYMEKLKIAEKVAFAARDTKMCG